MRFTLSLFLGVLGCNLASAQYIDVQENFTAQQLVEDILINSPCANVSNFSVSGWNDAQSYGYFTAGTSDFPFDDGVLISTGRATSAIGPNTSLLSEGSTNWPGDDDLEQAINENNTINATVLEFDFLPIANKMTFEYIFSSEQYFAYNNPTQCNYSDGFAFLLREAGTQDQYINLAVVPGTNTPVKITTIRGEGTICEPANTQYFDAFNGTEHPTNFNGQTTILTAEATVTPGILYHMKLVVADQGNSLYDSAIFLGGGSFDVETDLGPDRLFATNNPLCFGEEYLLDATLAGSSNYQWFRDSAPIAGATNATYTATEDGFYEVEVNNNGCVVNGSVTLEYDEPITLQNTTLIQCEDNSGGIAVFNLFDASEAITDNDSSVQVVSFHTSQYNAENNIAVIPNPNSYTNTIPGQVVYARAENQTGCAGVAEVTLTTTDNFLDPQELVSCSASNNPEAGVFDLNETTQNIQNQYGTSLEVSYHTTLEDALLGADALALSYVNVEPVMQTIYARLTNNGNCFGIIPVYLTVIPSPQFSGPESLTYCLNTFPEPLVLESGVVGDINDYSFSWNTGANTPTINITEAGQYTVDVSYTQSYNGQNYTCTSTRTLTVLASETPALSYTLSGSYGNQAVTINASGNGDYLYALNNENGPFQEAPIFENLSGGVYTVYVLDLNGCGIVSINVFVIGFPNYFTPNEDGTNDTWRVEGINLRDSLVETIVIFDRYGKIIYLMNPDSGGWDGTYRGRPLPSSDYWYKAYFVDGSTYGGHFTLKR
tara:strand:+ start:244175 stop:246493 length:2319 start_codon:yes stop_codon:yes gene_type:complete